MQPVRIKELTDSCGRKLWRTVVSLACRAQAKINTLRRLWNSDRARLLQALFGQCRLYVVYCARPQDVPPPFKLPTMHFRRLGIQELMAEARRNSELEYQLDALRQVGESCAYGLFEHGSLAHICLFTTAKEHDRLRIRLIKLQAREAEISHAYTLPAYRGRGMYRCAIQFLCGVARQQNLERVFMVTRYNNLISQRAITKAGFHRRGWIIRVILPLSPSRTGLIFRLLRRV